MASYENVDHREPRYILPKFEDLPPVAGQPQGCLWGFFDKPGKKDELGSKFGLCFLPYSKIFDVISSQLPQPIGGAGGSKRDPIRKSCPA